MVYKNSHKSCTVLLHLFVRIYMQTLKWSITDVKVIRDFLIWNFAIHNHWRYRCFIWILNISRPGRDMEKLSITYSTISRVLLNKTINRVRKISFHKHFNGKGKLNWPGFFHAINDQCWLKKFSRPRSLIIQWCDYNHGQIVWKLWVRPVIFLIKVIPSNEFSSIFY